VDKGMCFAAFMSCVIIGGLIGSTLLRIGMSEALCIFLYLVVACVSMVTCSVSSSNNWILRFNCFCIFEGTYGVHVGVFYPFRGKIVPEAFRSTILNFYRLPLNLMVVIFSIVWSHIHMEWLFLTGAVVHLIAAACCVCLITMRAKQAPSGVVENDAQTLLGTN